MGRAVGSWPRRLLLLPPQPGKASRSIWAVDARAEVLEVGTHDGQSGVMLAGVEIAHIQPAHLVGVVGVVVGAWQAGRLAGTTYLSSSRALPWRLRVRSWSCGDGSEVRMCGMCA